MGGDSVADRLEVFVHLLGLRGRLHAFLGHEVVGEEPPYTDFVVIGEGSRSGRGLRV
jgi:hypothetical protein